MNKQLVNALEVCLQAMEHGERLEAALARYPHLARELCQLLETTQAARNLSRQGVPAATVTRGRARLLAAAVELREEKKRRFFLPPVWRIVFGTLIVAAFLALSGGGLLTASARSLPGDTLYPLKRSFEEAQMKLVFDPGRKQELQEEFYQRRIEETESLIHSHRVVMVEFDGIVTARTDEGWMVSGIRVVVTPQTQQRDSIEVGLEVEVRGETQTDGSVRAFEISGHNGEQGKEESESDAAVTSTGDHGKTREAELQETMVPEGTEIREDRHEGEQSLEPADSHGGKQDGIKTPEPTEPGGSEDGADKTPEPAEDHDGGDG